MEFGAMHKCAVLVLALIAYHLVQPIEGRQLKSVNKQDLKQSSQTDKSALHNEYHQPDAPSYTPTVSHYSVSGKKEVLPPAIPTKSLDFGDFVDRDEDDFRPTTPGNSPGVGHRFAEDNEEVEQLSGSTSRSNERHSVSGGEEEFRPTNPGHSPGVGHAFVSKNSEPNP